LGSRTPCYIFNPPVRSISLAPPGGQLSPRPVPFAGHKQFFAMKMHKTVIFYLKIHTKNSPFPLRPPLGSGHLLPKPTSSCRQQCHIALVSCTDWVFTQTYLYHSFRLPLTVRSTSQRTEVKNEIRSLLYAYLFRQATAKKTIKPKNEKKTK